MSQTFVSVHRHDPVRRIFFEKLLPLAVWITGAVALVIPTLLLASVWDRVGPDDLPRLLLMIAGVAALLGTGPLLICGLMRLNRRELHETCYRLDDEGLTRRRGARTQHYPWPDLISLRPFGLGRLQLARLETASGSLWFDGALVEETTPPPRLRWGLFDMRIECPDGRRRSLRIQESELYQALVERIATRD